MNAVSPQSLGGTARAENLSPARRTEIASTAAAARWGKARNNQRAVEMGEQNRKAVRDFFSTFLCATQRECAKALGLSPMAVNRHVADIRRTWREPSPAPAPTRDWLHVASPRKIPL